jgi:hypothetical protein
VTIEHKFRGPLLIANYLREHLWGWELRLVPRRANSQPALAPCRPDRCARLWRASSLVVPTLRDDRVSMLARFGDLGLLAASGSRTLPRD